MTEGNTPTITPLLPNPGAAAESDAPAPPPTKEEARAFAREFLLGELIASAKKEFLSLTKPFGELSQYDQESLLRRMQHTVETAVKEAIEVISSDGRLTFRADVESVTFKDGVKASLKLGKSEHAHILADQAGKTVLIVVEDFARYLNPGDATKGEPDQPALFDKSRAAAEEKAAGEKKPKGRVPKRKGRKK